MNLIVSIARLRESGIELRADEAVAVTQQLIHNRRALQPRLEPEPSSGSLSIDNLYLSRDGSVCSRGYDTAPAVSEIALLLQSLVSPATPVPGKLRYAIARALLEVDAAPFESLDEFSDALARFEHSDRGALIRGVIDRWEDATRVARPSFPAAIDRRRHSAALASDLRRHLREADALLYQHQVASAAQHQAATAVQRQAAAAAPIENRIDPPSPRPRFLPSTAACLAAGIALIALGAFAHFQSVQVTPLPAVAAVPIAPAPIATTDLQPPQPLASATQPVTPAPQTTTEPRHSAKRPIKLPRGVEARDARADASKRSHRTAPRSMLEKLRLQWLKNAFTVQSAPL